MFLRQEHDPMDAFFTIDFEASCLPRHGRSFPIEVGLADLHGWSRSWLIRPADAWANWTWTEEAESLHGIDRATLEREGLPPSQVIAELNTVLSGRRTVADHSLDAVWLNTLSAAAGITPGFEICHISDYLDLWQPDSAMIERAMVVAGRCAPIRYRARMDALWLATVAGQLIPKTVKKASRAEKQFSTSVTGAAQDAIEFVAIAA